MIITLDNLASRYNCLPSEALAKATTLDLHVLDVSARWDRHKQGHEPEAKAAPNLSQDQLLKLLNKAKEKNA